MPELPGLILHINDLLSHSQMKYSYRLQCPVLVVSLDILSKQRGKQVYINHCKAKTNMNMSCEIISNYAQI